MKELLYTALDVAAIISNMELGCQAESQMIDKIWEGEQTFLQPQYRGHQRQFILDVRYWLNYFYDKPILDKEFPILQRDVMSQDMVLDSSQFTHDCSDLDLFFKQVRIRILYGGGQPFVRLKMRTLIREYGYKARSKALMEHINRNLLFYHLEGCLRGETNCDLKEIKLDQMITFRVV